jgi:hypothetical protein
MTGEEKRKKVVIHIYNKDANPSTKSTRHVKGNANTPKENEDHQNK